MPNGNDQTIDWSKATFKTEEQSNTTQLDWSKAQFKSPEQPQLRESVSIFEAFADGFTEDMSFGYVDMKDDADVYATKAGGYAKLAGITASMLLQSAALSAVTFGIGGVTLFSAKSANLAKAAKNYNDAKKAYQAGKLSKANMIKKQTSALEQGGVGIPNSKLLGLGSAIKSNTTQKMYLDKFMRLAADDVNKARKMVLMTEATREGMINAAIGQKFINEETLGREVTIKDRLAFGTQDLLAGGLFGAGRAYSFSKNLLPKIGPFGQDRSPDWFNRGSLYFASGFLTALPQHEGQENGSFMDRVTVGAVSAAMGSLMRGGVVSEAVDDVQRGLRRIGVQDEKIISEVTDMSIRIAVNRGVKQVNDDFQGMVLKNIDDDKDVVIQRVKSEGEGNKQKVYVDYDVVDAADNNKILQRKENVDAGEFFKSHKRQDYKEIEAIKNNFKSADDDSQFSFFKNEKELKNFLNTQKYGVLTADGPAYTNFRGLGGDTKASELMFSDGNDFLIRELLRRGYKRDDILAVRGNWNGGGENSFVVKNLKKSDAIDLMKIFGQSEVAMNDGYIKLLRNADGSMEAITAKNKFKTQVGKTARFKKDGKTEHEFFSTVELQNGRETSFRNNYEMTKGEFDYTGKGIRGLSSKFISGEVNSALDSSLDKFFKTYRTTAARKDKIFQIKNMEIEKGLAASDDPFKNLGAKSLKEQLFGVDSMKKMSSKQLDTYANLLSGKEDFFGKKFRKGDYNALGDIPEVLGKNEYLLNNVALPIITKYRNFAKTLNNPLLKKLADNLEDYTITKNTLEGDYQLMRDRQKDKYTQLGLTKKEIEEIDTDLGLYIEKREDLASLRKNYKNRAHMKKAINYAVGEHKKYSTNIVKYLKRLGVEEFYYDKKTRTLQRRPISVVENFVSRQITEEATEFFARTSDDSRDFIIKEIIRRDARFKGKGEFASLPKSEQEKIADELFSIAQPNNAKYGVYGQQFARTADLPPYLYLDKKGRVIKDVDNFNYVKGDKINDIEVGEVIKVYDMNYAANMDRYASRVSNLAAFSKYFGNRGIFDFDDTKNVREFNTMFKDRLNGILKQVKNKEDRRKLEEMINSDFKVILGGDNVDEAVAQWYSSMTSWTAATGLSSPRSAIKNALLGNVQLVSTFGLTPVLRTYFNFAFDANAWKNSFGTAQSINALQVSEKALETVIQKQGLSGRIQRGLTTGMRIAEQTNRRVSVVTGMKAAEDALKVLRGESPGFFNKMTKTEAQRLLRNTMNLDGINEAIKTGSFSKQQQRKILFMSHSTTQGLADPVFMPRWMSKPYVKPLTLFYRIAYRVTENVYKNAYVPALRGDVAPMMRYVAATVGAGAALQTLYYKAFNTEPEKFRDAGDRFWSYFVDGEGLGIFSTLGQLNRDFSQAYTPAVIQFGTGLYGAVSKVTKGAFLSDTDGERNALIKQGTRDLVTSVPLVNDIVKSIENNSEQFTIPGIIQPKKAYQEVLNIRTQVRSYDNDVRELSGFNKDFSQSEEQSLMYRQLQANVYANRPMDKKVKDFYATVAYLQHQYEINNPGVYTKQQAYNKAYKRAERYIDYYSQPVKSRLTTSDKDKVISLYDDFVRRLNDEDKASLKELEKIHRKNSIQYRREVRRYKNKYRP
jgi:hypothetical protein